MPKTILHRIELIIIITLALLYGWATYQRNFIWKDDLTLWSDVAGKSRNAYRPHNNLGLAYFQKKQYDYAIQQYFEALRLYPKGHVNVFIGLGNVYEKMGRYELAVNAYDNAVKLEPSFYGAYVSIGNLYNKQGKKEEAIEVYRKAIALKPSNPVLYYNLGVLYDEAGFIDEAMSNYLKALDIYPDHPNARANLGVIYGNKGLLDRAVAEFEAALRIKPDDAVTLFNLAIAYEQIAMNSPEKPLGRESLNKAVNAYQKILAIEPGNVKAKEKLLRLGQR